MNSIVYRSEFGVEEIETYIKTLENRPLTDGDLDFLLNFESRRILKPDIKFMKMKKIKKKGSRGRPKKGV